MDWKIIIAEIARHGKLTQTQIAEKVGHAQTTISDLAKGNTKQPNYALGCALMNLFEECRASADAETFTEKHAEAM